jgi:signal transduction histidine kinase
MNQLRSRLFRTESFRLAFLLALLFVGASLGLTVAMYLVTQNALNRDFANSVRSNLAAVEEAYRNEGLPEAVEIVNQLTASTATTDYYVLQGADGAKLAGNLPAMIPVFELTTVPPPPRVRNAREHGVLGEGKRLPDGSYIFAGADSYQLVELREHTLLVFILITGTTIVLTLAGGMLLSANALKRTDAVIEVCRAIAANRWDRRVPVRGEGAESDLLATTINGMLDRLAALMENLRQVSSDIAHDLRTPLTHMRQRLERAQIEARSPDDYNAAMERALADSDELLAIFSALLSLSQIEAGIRPANRDRVDLTALLTHLAETYRPVADDNGQRFDAAIAPDVKTTGDRALLMQMFSNLIENAIRHSPAGAAISLSLAETAGGVVARVADTGPGIPAGDLHRVFDRFWRGEASRGMSGHGLGLALVAAIAKLHQITITLGDNTPGLAAELRLPGARSATP